jgi:hypothetical protein
VRSGRRHTRHARHAGEVGKATGAGGRERETAGRGEREAVGGHGGHALGAGREGRHGRHTATATRGRRKALGKLARRGTRHAGEGRRNAAREAKGRGRKAAAGLVLGKHGVRVGLALGGVGGGDGVDDGLGLFVADLLVIVDDVSQVVSAAVVGLAHAHGVVREVDIAVVAEEFGHLGCWTGDAGGLWRVKRQSMMGRGGRAVGKLEVWKPGPMVGARLPHT